MGLAAYSPDAMNSPEEIRVETIHMGEYSAASDHAEIRTLLGSCVCVCLWDPGSRIGGANHFQLPDSPSDVESARYGVHAMELLINRMMAMGADRRRLVAMAFGGAAVIPALTRHHVGSKNAAFTKRFLETETIPLLGGDLGGVWPRQVRFRVQTGEAKIRRLPGTEASRLAATEARGSLRLANTDAAKGSGHVELF